MLTKVGQAIAHRWLTMFKHFGFGSNRRQLSQDGGAIDVPIRVRHGDDMDDFSSAPSQTDRRRRPRKES